MKAVLETVSCVARVGLEWGEADVGAQIIEGFGELQGL